MSLATRRDVLRLLAAAPFAASGIARAGGCEDRNGAALNIDWSRGMVETTMQRIPDPARLGGWGYAISLYLYGQYLLYQREKKPEYLRYIQGWVDSHVREDGTIDRPITALDYMLPGNLLLVLYKETKLAKYKTAADTIRHTFDNYPRTADGGLWHAYSREHQLWLDGMFMSMPFLTRYGQMFGESKSTLDEAAKQLMIYARHLNDPASGLMFHAYDESGQQSWADPVTHHSAIFWCRAIGWFGMALIEVLEITPHNHPRRADLIAQVRQLCGAYERYQDSATGLWYQVVDKGSDPRNWHETSSSSMFTYTLSKAVQRGYVPRKFARTACKGYAGVLTQLSRGDDGSTHIDNICEGTNVSDIDYYYARKKQRDDFHGLGAFLIMNEHMRTAGC